MFPFPLHLDIPTGHLSSTIPAKLLCAFLFCLLGVTCHPISLYYYLIIHIAPLEETFYWQIQMEDFVRYFEMKRKNISSMDEDISLVLLVMKAIVLAM